MKISGTSWSRRTGSPPGRPSANTTALLVRRSDGSMVGWLATIPILKYTKPASDRAPWHRTSVKGRLSTWCPGKRIQSAQRISCFLIRIDFNILKMNERSKNLAEHSATGHSTLPSVGTRTTDRSIRCIPGLGGNCIMSPLRRVASCPIGCLNVTVLPGNKSCNDASSVFFCLVNPINDRIFRFEQVVPKPFFCYFLYIPASCGRWSPYHSSALRPEARPTNGPHDSWLEMALSATWNQSAQLYGWLLAEALRSKPLQPTGLWSIAVRKLYSTEFYKRSWRWKILRFRAWKWLSIQ